MSGKITLEIEYREHDFPNGDFTADHMLVKHIKKMIPTQIWGEDIKGVRDAGEGRICLVVRNSVRVDKR